MMAARPYKMVLILSFIAGIMGHSRAAGKVIDDGPQSLNQISSIGESLRNAGPRPLHILYVHGIGATGAGGSKEFQKAVCAFLKDCTIPAAPVGRDYADSGMFENDAETPAYAYMGDAIYRNKEEWRASAPFVDHYVLRRSDGGPLVVDEINWWPLVVPVKCRALLAGDARLAGPDPTLLKFCSQPPEMDSAHPGRFMAYTWMSPDEATTLKALRPRGALINRRMKTILLDWGFSDALMAAGSMQDVFREGIRQLFLKSVRFNADGSKTNAWEQQLKDPHGVDREFIVVSHSLGSYLVFATLTMGQRDSLLQSLLAPTQNGAAAEDAAAQYILERTSLVYFFANQVPMLELANLGGPGAAGLRILKGLVPGEAIGVLSTLMTKWEDLRQTFVQRSGGAEGTPAKKAQLVAWSDPSDLLTWRLPALKGLVISNLYVRNSGWHWIFANPGAAHDNYMVNKEVLRIMLGPKAATAKGKGGKE
jgi:hypothetical protein